MSHQNESRGSARLPIKTQAVFSLVRPDETLAFKGLHGVAENISMTGLRIRTSQISRAEMHSLDVRHMRMTIHLSLPLVAHSVFLDAKVIWCDWVPGSAGMPASSLLGVKFDDLDAETRAVFQGVFENVRRSSVDSVPKMRPSAEAVRKPLDPLKGKPLK